MSRGNPRRPARVAERVKQELMDLLLRGAVRDPGASGVFVSSVTVSSDLKHARVYVRLTKNNTDQATRSTAVRALTRARSYLRRQLAPRLELKYLPELTFHWDEQIDRAARVEELLREINREQGREEQ